MTFLTDAVTLREAARILEAEKQRLCIRALVPQSDRLSAAALAEGMTPEDRLRYIELLAEGMPYSEAAEMVGRASKLAPQEWGVLQDIRLRRRAKAFLDDLPALLLEMNK